MSLPAGMNVNSDGYLRFHRPSSVRDRYAHRLYADRQMRESLGRGLRPDEVVHHLCQNKLCWPPSDYHLLICDKALHDAFDAGVEPYKKHWARRTDIERKKVRNSA